MTLRSETFVSAVRGLKGACIKFIIQSRSLLEEDVMWCRKQPDWMLIRKIVGRWGVMQSGEGLH